jgi:hypothetical protein
MSNAIQSAEVYEANVKAINDICLRSVAKENTANITATDKTVIDYISSQCPYTGGTAVYVARALQASIRKDTFYNDTENCFTQGVNYRTVKPKIDNEEVEQSVSIKLYPNPASDFVVIKSNENLQGNIDIINNLGQIVTTTTIQGQKEFIISTTTLSEGMYFVRLIGEQGVYLKEKLIIVK